MGMRSKRKTYTLAGFVFLLLAFALVMYPIASYYLGIYLGSNHSIRKPGSSFTYVGALVSRTYVYHFEVLENGSYNFTAILYRGGPGYGYSQSKSPPRDWRFPFFTNMTRDQVKEICEVNMILPRNDSLVRLFFPKDAVYLLNRSRPIVKLPPLEDHGYINWYFLPKFLGFPRLYAPEGLERFNKTLAVKLNSSEYFPVVRYLKASDGYYIIAYNSHIPQTFEPLQLGRVFDHCLNTWLLVKMYNGDFPPILLVNSNVQPLSQDWKQAIKYSAIQYTAPVDFVLILTGVILLILAGRARG
ncbi:hypothetical protein [Thermococcus sp.]|uniref:hypothetical protein n=1 Tax=Thermococcus sp. TaxID=35749 RepID=UPI0026352492|nr:hypothetical protein [Thermococcus sp.]